MPNLDDASMDVGIVPARSIILGQDKEFTEKNFLDAVDSVVQNLYQEGNIAVADKTIDTLLIVQHFAGRSLAKMLWGTKQWWDETGQSAQRNDTFEDHMKCKHGIKATQLSRYTLVWEYTQNNTLPKKITHRPMKDQIHICAMLEQGFEPSKEQWKELEQAANESVVLEIIRKVKKKKPKKGSLQIYMERDGSLSAWMNGEQKFIGYLNVDEEADDIIGKAIARVVNCTGIQRK